MRNDVCGAVVVWLVGCGRYTCKCVEGVPGYLYLYQ